ncbi:hypothetical protein [Rothia dentocariosa]|uniref:hypothetical protein n=1 Tax=Rothia dentocariosa TaxID=2047 RepID=UPI00249372FF|nr:hypothetical protein [Rothia dentocariosa]
MVPFVIAGALMALAFGAHVFIGTRETLSLRPVAHPANTENMVSAPANHTELSRHWAQAMCAFQLVSIDLLLITIVTFLLAFTDLLPAKREIGLFIAAYLGAWGFVWLVQLAAVKVERRTYYMLGQWMLFFLCAAFMVWGSLAL